MQKMAPEVLILFLGLLLAVQVFEKIKIAK
jgi:hypothetical protein